MVDDRTNDAEDQPSPNGLDYFNVWLKQNETSWSKLLRGYAHARERKTRHYSLFLISNLKVPKTIVPDIIFEFYYHYYYYYCYCDDCCYHCDSYYYYYY